LAGTDDGAEAPFALPLDRVKEPLTFMGIAAIRAWCREQQ
jgi:hypothetical protein